MKTSEILENASLFKLLDERQRGELEREFERREYAAGETVFSIGEPGDAMYFVGTGCVELSVKDNTGAKIVLANAGPGEEFGELSLFDGGARTASAVSTESSTLLVLDRDGFLQFLRRHPDASLNLLNTMGQRMRSTDELLRRHAARNINEELAINSTPVELIADVIAAFSGSITFLLLNAAWFAFWIIWNTLPGVRHFDPYPFGFLTMVVSLEAIFLSIFVLVSQNRQAAKDRLRADAEYEVNLKAELEVAHLHEKMDFLTEELLARLPRPERTSSRNQAVSS
jgi:CRP/FNR family cyclic AMP-dependent transcriptional regulator